MSRTLSSRDSREPEGAHWCPPELVEFGWGHFSHHYSQQAPLGSLNTNKVQPEPSGQTEQTGGRDESDHHQQSSTSQGSEDGAETEDVEQVESTEEEGTEKTGESLDPDLMVTLCESPHRFLATLDDDLSLDLPSVPM